MQYKTLNTFGSLASEPVLLRADLNVPLANGTISDDFKLKAIQPTLDALLDKQAQIVLITHLGRPSGQEPSLSTKQLLPWFLQRGYQIQFCATIDEARSCVKNPKPNSIVLLENLRFFEGEKERDLSFAQKLSALGTYFVHDAFGVAHRDDASVTLVPEQFDSARRAFGLRIVKELQLLDALKKPRHPFMLIIGGAKLKTKIPLIRSLLDQVDCIALCPAIVFTFMKALGKPIGTSLVDDSLLDACNQLLDQARDKNVQILMPVDFQVKVDHRLFYADEIRSDAQGISIGPKTIELLQKKMTESQIIFFNGAIGFGDEPETLHGMRKIFQMMGASSAQTFVAGGDSVGFLNSSRISGIDHVFTGGGAALAYLSDQPMPGLAAFF